MTSGLSSARWPEVPTERGHYESFYLKTADPERPRGAWIRYTVLKRPGSPPRGSLWCTVWTDAGPPSAYKQTFPEAELSAGADELIRIGPARLVEDRATGALDQADWDLELRGESQPFPYLPRAWMYRAPVPRTKAVSLHPLARFRGRVTVGEDSLTIDDWPGMVGHNWGTEHAERWIWMHGAGFPAAPDAWFDVIIGRIRVGRLTLPWIANGGLWLDGRLHRLGGPAAVRSTSVQEAPTRCTFGLTGGGVALRGEVAAPPELPVAWRYSDPGGGEHVSTNCSVAALTLNVKVHDGPERVLRLPAGAAYELGTREPPPGIPIQSFPDP
jgi:hypothetical protein